MVTPQKLQYKAYEPKQAELKATPKPMPKPTPPPTPPPAPTPTPMQAKAKITPKLPIELNPKDAVAAQADTDLALGEAEHAFYGDAQALKQILAEKTTRKPVKQPTTTTTIKGKSKKTTKKKKTTPIPTKPTKRPTTKEDVERLEKEMKQVVDAARKAHMILPPMPAVPIDKDPQFDTHEDAYKGEDEADKKAGFVFKQLPSPQATATGLLDADTRKALSLALKNEYRALRVVAKKVCHLGQFCACVFVLCTEQIWGKCSLAAP